MKSSEKKPRSHYSKSPSIVKPSGVRRFGRREEIFILVGILALAAFLRVYHLGQSPPWMNVDEGATSWNSYCLLKTGMDQHGVRWPIFDSAGYGQGTTTLYLYLTIPFQALGGLNAVTSRMPAALCGVMTVFLIYYVGKRLFGRGVGIAAAVLLALNPWHLQQSRWGHMATLFPLISIAPLATMLWAGFPFDDDDSRPMSPWKSGLAGAIGGIGCYGYYAARLWVPIFYTAIVAATWRAWWNRLRTRQGLLAIGALLLTGLLTFGPLLWATWRFPLASKRAEATWVWSPSDSLVTRIENIAVRYPGHFAPDFLFERGDPDPAYSPPNGYGLFLWYTAPMMLLGLVFLIPSLKESRSARVLMTWVALYPLADLFNEHPTMHALRSLPGASALTLLAAVGAVFSFRWLKGRRKKITIALTVLTFVFVLVSSGRFLGAFYVDFDKEPLKYFSSHQDLLQACEWLKPRLQDEDAVFVTGSGMSHPYIYTLVGLQYDPRQWFRDEKRMVEMQGAQSDRAYRNEEICLRYGKLHFMFGNSARGDLEQLVGGGRTARVVFIVHPGELPEERQIAPAYQISDPQGKPSLLIFEVTMGQ
ncbi:MAG: glycosyltransferase family 39 protein [Acidobacteriia bacterium]|nr:glycosyltransferase family 39 protein [Terriglobia bacterium]